MENMIKELSYATCVTGHQLAVAASVLFTLPDVYGPRAAFFESLDSNAKHFETRAIK